MSSSSALTAGDDNASTTAPSHQRLQQNTIEVFGRYRRLNQRAPCDRQRVYLVRSAHRLDHSDPDWIALSQLNQDSYTPISIDFPIKLPRRRNNRQDYACDPPLSEFGQLTGLIAGRELRLQGVDIRYIFAASALSCVQTAAAIIKGYRTDVKVCIEPGLADYPTSSSLMTPHELRAVGYPIDVNYSPQFVDETNEPPQQQYERIGRVVRSLLKYVQQHGGSQGSTLMVGNALTVDAIIRSLRNRPLSTALTSETAALDLHYPACCALALEQSRDRSEYNIVTSAVRPITHLDTTNAVDLTFADRA
uniref:Uncharacterized protein n=1 Tax=Plectus sambesii TaxID=2011161 RepID=A0A914V0C6_9BILA